LLGGLVTKQFLTVETDPRSQSRGTYSFVHRQVQRVVLGTLSKRERKARHLAAVEFLSGHDPDLAAILAEHLVAALEAHPTAEDADEIRARALRLTLDAAQRADAVGALNEAVALFARAAEIETDERRRAEHLIRAARCAERYGNQETVAAGHYAAARELHEHAGRRREALALRARELHAYQWSRPSSELTGPLRDVYTALEDEHDAAFADAAASLADILYVNGEPDSAALIAAQAAEAAEQAGAHEELGVALNCRACALIELARPVEALPLFEAALELRRRYAPAAVPASLGNVAITLAALGRFEEAVSAGREAVAAGERAASRVHRNLAALQLARALFSLGNWEESVATVEEVAAETAPSNRGMVIGPPLLVALHRGENEQARTVIKDFDRDQADSGAAFESDYRSLREVALAHLSGDLPAAVAVVEHAQSGDYAEWPTWLPLAIDLLAGSPEDEPLRAAAEALRRDLVPRTSPIIVAQVARLDALLAARGTDLALAAARWSAAIDAVSAAGMAFDAAALTLELHEQAIGHSSPTGGLQPAIETFSRLRATPWLKRAQRVSAATARALR
jgi:tetratricopeptide (TPR) repeat protein